MKLLVNVDYHFKMVPTYYLYFNCSKFHPKKPQVGNKLEKVTKSIGKQE